MSDLKNVENKDEDQSVFPQWRNFLSSGNSSENKEFFRQVVKRNGSIEKYDRSKIEDAISKAIEAVSRYPDEEKAKALTDKVEESLRILLAGRRAHSIPAIEEIQDVVENVLIEAKEVEVAKAYILYRAKHEAIRDSKSLMLDINATMDG